MNETVVDSHSGAISLRGVLPDSIVAKINDERAVKDRSIQSSFDLTKSYNRDAANIVCREFEITEMHDDYRDFADLVNKTVRTKSEIACLFNILNGNSLGLHFLNKLNLETFQEETVREAFIAWAKKFTGALGGVDEIDEYICMAYNAILEDQRIDPKKEWDHAGYSADSATRFRRKPPPCSAAKRHGIPDDSATPGRSVATLVFSSFS